MLKWPLSVAIALVLMPGIWNSASAQEGAGRKEQRQQATKPSGRYEKLNAVSDADLHLRLQDASDEIALTAAWEEVLRSGINNSATVGPIEAASLKRFVGYTNGRLKVNFPSWWENAFLGAVAAGRNDVRFRLSRNSFEPQGTDARFGPIDSVIADDGGDHVTIAVGAESLSIERAQWEAAVKSAGEMSRSHYFASCLMTESNCYLALTGNGPLPYPVYCFDRSDGSKRWERIITIAEPGIHYEVPHSYFVEMIMSNDRLFVFGGGGFMYCAILDAETGKSRGTFTTRD